VAVSVAARRDARERVLRMLFALDFTGNDWEDELDTALDQEPATGEVRKYCRVLLGGIEEHREDLEAKISAALDSWTPDRVGRVEMALLRLGAYELLYARDVPPKAAINEVLELAKRYAPDGATSFLNGVLDRLYHEKNGAAEQDED
jgi:N utilization substance protein B